MNLLEKLNLGLEKQKKTFKPNKTAYTIHMKTMHIQQLFQLLSKTEGELFGILLHKHYENNRDLILTEEVKDYIFSELGWDGNSKNRKDQFTKLLKSLDEKDVLTKVSKDRVVINPFVCLLGGVNNFISTTIHYYLEIRAKRGMHSKSAKGFVYDIFEKTYKSEIEEIVEQLSQNN